MTVLFQSGLNRSVNWVLLKNDYARNVTLQNVGGSSMFVKATTGLEPTTTSGAIEYPPNNKEVNVDIDKLFPGELGSYFLWAYANGPTKAFISNATGRNLTISIDPASSIATPPAKWVQLTESATDRVTFQNLGNSTLYVKGTNTNAAPDSIAGALEYPGAAKETYVRLAELFPGVAGVNRLWAYAYSHTTAFVSHRGGVNKTIAIAASETFSNARIAHSLNWLSGGVATASSTQTGYFANAPLNTLTYEKWKPITTTGGTWEYDHGSSASVDYCAIAAHTLGTSGSTLYVQYYDGSDWINIITGTTITDNSPIIVFFGAITAQIWRIYITDSIVAPEVGVIKFGSALQMPQAIYGGHSPIIMARQTVLRTNYSETGEFLGRTKQRVQLGNTYNWTHIKADWMRSNWPTLQKAIEAEPFWIAWRPGDYGEVGFSQVDSVPIPQNMGIKDFMSVEMTTRARAWD